VKFRVCVPARPLWPVLLAAIVTLGAGSGFAQSLTGLNQRALQVQRRIAVVASVPTTIVRRNAAFLCP
jgi:hypothetical protein